MPILQGLCLTRRAATGRPTTTGCPRWTSATQVAIPEFDGRLITVPFSFKETDADGLTTYVADPERAARVAGIAVRARPAAAHPAAEQRRSC